MDFENGLLPPESLTLGQKQSLLVELRSASDKCLVHYANDKDP